MIGLIIELAVSWLLLWFFDKSNLSVLGFQPSRSRALDFAFGFLVASAFCTAYFLSVASLSDNSFALNPVFTPMQFLKSSGFTLTSVLYEELIFRGALFYIALKKLGFKKACLISAAAFGVYHWFSFGALGNPVQMIIIFLMTGIWGWMFAIAFARTKSLYLPIGLHLGWNLINNVVFSAGPSGRQLFVNSPDLKLEGVLSLIFFIGQIVVLPIFTYFYLKPKGK